MWSLSLSAEYGLIKPTEMGSKLIYSLVSYLISLGSIEVLSDLHNYVSTFSQISIALVAIIKTLAEYAPAIREFIKSLKRPKNAKK